MINKIKSAQNYIKFLYNFFLYKKISRNDNRFYLSWEESYPCLNDNTKTTPYDPHYTYHPAWAARMIKRINPVFHVDISSILYYSCMLSTARPVFFCDYRPPHIKLSNLSIIQLDLCHLPFKTNSIPSLSCMHTIEHIGLGRYGDTLHPLGDLRAIEECKRVLSKDGNFLFVVPIGKMAKIQYNAHRIYTYDMIINMFSSFKLMDFSFITDQSEYIEKANKKDTLFSTYGCGCFWFHKEE